MKDSTSARRAAFAARIRALGTKQATAFADFLVHSGTGEPMPCWGGIARRFAREFAGDKERVALLEVLVAAAELRPLLLFLHHNRERPAVLAAFAEVAERCPVLVQRYWAVLPEAEDYLEAQRLRLSPVAQRLSLRARAEKAAERNFFDNAVRELLTIDHFQADRHDPAREAERLAMAQEPTPTPRNRPADNANDPAPQASPPPARKRR
jgi:hypothetical protein